MTLVKICGIRTTEHALAALEYGADFLGFIFAPARRQVQPEEVATITAAVRAAPGGDKVRFTGVFVNETPERMLEVAAIAGLDAIQLSGDEPISVLHHFRQISNAPQLIKAVRLNGSAIEQTWFTAADNVPFLVDAHVPGSYGGAGVVGDWPGAADLAQRYRVLLAGGLHPNNVVAAITAVQPWAVDVSSGVETNGIKDTQKIKAFIQAVRQSEQNERLNA